MGRQFIAVVPAGLAQNQEVKKLMGKLKRTMEDRSQEARWVSPALWHVTLQFLGDVDSGRHDQLKEALNAWDPAVNGLCLRLQGLGAFPSPEESRVLWMGVQESQDFLDLQARLEQLLSDHGFAASEREFRPHLALARFRNTINAVDLIGLGGRKHFGDYPLSEFILFESVLQGNVLKYVPQFRKPIG